MSQAKGATPVPSRATTQTQPDGSERRREPRLLVDFEVDYASEDNYLFAYITDISSTGIFIRTTSPEAPGTNLNLRFSPPPDPDHDDRPFEVEGEVIWWNPYRPGQPDNLHPGMGVRFSALDDQQRRRIVALIRRIAYLT
jgi:uncharacterized protein (TIGR02266 family)